MGAPFADLPRKVRRMPAPGFSVLISSASIRLNRSGADFPSLRVSGENSTFRASKSPETIRSKVSFQSRVFLIGLTRLRRAFGS